MSQKEATYILSVTLSVSVLHSSVTFSFIIPFVKEGKTTEMTLGIYSHMHMSVGANEVYIFAAGVISRHLALSQDNQRRILTVIC